MHPRKFSRSPPDEGAVPSLTLGNETGQVMEVSVGNTLEKGP